MVMKGQVAKLSGFQDEVGRETVGILMVGLTMFTGGKMSAMSSWVNAETGRQIMRLFLAKYQRREELNVLVEILFNALWSFP